MWHLLISGCSSHSSSLPLSNATHLAFSMRQKWSEFLGQHPTLPGKPGIHSHVLTSSVEESMGRGGLSWYWDVPPWERGDSSKMKLFLLPSSMPLISETFAPTVCWLQDFHKGSVICERMSKICVLWVGGMVENSHSTILMISLSRVYFLIQVWLRGYVWFVTSHQMYTYDLCTFHHYLTFE